MLQHVMHDVFDLCKPKNISPLVFDSPHSGTIFPEDFQGALSGRALEACADEHIDALFKPACEAIGAPLLSARIARVYIDLNRRADDIDPLLLDQPWQPAEAIHPSARSDAGIGLIRRLIGVDATPVYKRTLSQAEIQQRINLYYHPYHKALQDLLESAYKVHGKFLHINCHSMPDSCAAPRRPIGLHHGRGKTADFVIGDRDGTSCDPALTRALRDYISALGYDVTINDPFKGVELVERYSSPALGRHALQLEINKRLYMDEITGKIHSNTARVQDDLEKICTFLQRFISTL